MRKPGIDSSLSSVPPVCPRPRPEIIGTTTPAAAAMGAQIRLVLSPTPPVECLSTLTPGMSARFRDFPGRHHDFGERAQLPIRHAGEISGHEERGHLVVGNLAGGVPVDQVLDFFHT